MGNEREPKDGTLDIGAKFEPLTGGASGHVKADGSLARYVAPELYRRQAAFDTLMAGIRLKQDRDQALDPLEQQVLAASIIDVVSGKLENVKAVVQFAREQDPAFGTYVKGKVPMLEAPKALPPAAHGADELDIDVTVVEQETQYWWDRFWADAEVVTAEYIQRLLGEIAVRKSNEVKAVSLRTLDVVRCLEAEAARDFDTLTPYVVDGDNVPEHARFRGEYARVGLTFPRVLGLQDAGLINVAAVSMSFLAFPVGDGHLKVSASVVPTAEESGMATAAVMALTRAGRDLYRLRQRKPDATQTKRLVQFFARQAGKPLEWRPRESEPYEDVDNWADTTGSFAAGQRVAAAYPPIREPKT